MDRIIGNVTNPSFLTLPGRGSKPRATGLTHVLDKGASVATTSELPGHAASTDLWKFFGWGTAYLDRALPAKSALFAGAAVQARVGGTLLEIA